MVCSRSAEGTLTVISWYVAVHLTVRETFFACIKTHLLIQTVTITWWRVWVIADILLQNIWLSSNATVNQSLLLTFRNMFTAKQTLLECRKRLLRDRPTDWPWTRPCAECIDNKDETPQDPHLHKTDLTTKPVFRVIYGISKRWYRNIKVELIGCGYIINFHGKTVTKRRLIFSYRRFGSTYRPLSSRFKQSNKEKLVRKFLGLQPQVLTRNIQNKENG
jgi:hypothetical protein